MCPSAASEEQDNHVTSQLEGSKHLHNPATDQLEGSKHQGSHATNRWEGSNNPEATAGILAAEITARETRIPVSPVLDATLPPSIMDASTRETGHLIVRTPE
jgi:hypothetical protein